MIGPSYPFRGGIATFSNHLAKGLQEAGHTIHLFTYTVQYPRWLFRQNQISDEAPLPVPTSRLIHAFQPLSWLPAAKTVATFQPDLVIYPFWLPIMGFHAGFIARKVKRLYPQALHLGLIHNFSPHESRFGDTFFRRYYVGGMNAAFTLSQSVAEAWQKHTPKPIRFFWHPLFPPEINPLPSREAACARLSLDPHYRYVLFIGLVRPYKGLDLLLRAWAQILSQIGKEWKLLVAGEFYEAEAPYQALIQELGIRERVVWRPGFVPQADFGYYFRAAEGLVLPYRAATQSGHPFWAYQYERPILVTRVGGLHEVVEAFGGGFIVEPTVEGLMQGLLKLIQTPIEIFTKDFAEARAALRWEVLAEGLWEWATNLAAARKQSASLST